MPMDGFHFGNAVLDEMGLSMRKGSPRSFDVHGLVATLARIRSNPQSGVAIPVFDRTLDVAVGSARIITAPTEIILVEGNYLLLDDPNWTALDGMFDVSVEVRCKFETLERRLLRRWLDLGHSEISAREKLNGNDLPNCQLVLHNSRPSDFVFCTET